jgi:nitrite reductase/ring-hydroxylating ferredoxin subunit
VPWTDVLATDDVGPGARVGVDVGATRLVVWRTAGGALAACDARCPHQWSDLATDGEVQGEELVCRLHDWRFDPEGHGSRVSLAGDRVATSDAARVGIRERDGRIEVDVAEPAG